ncbi:hypothetical protein [Streptomyces sp. NPDC006368]|uniref:hypothetical protein n=1 Tax=Streptomyces sp. NPDC006368 TaxID=3156760 RepID=UPI0033B50669
MSRFVTVAVTTAAALLLTAFAAPAASAATALQLPPISGPLGEVQIEGPLIQSIML